MSRADQIARQQRRAFSVFRDTVPGDVIIGSTSYEVAIITSTASAEHSDGVHLTPESITFLLAKTQLSTELTMRTRVTHGGIPYFVDEVSGRGDMHQSWRVRAVRHRPA